MIIQIYENISLEMVQKFFNQIEKPFSRFKKETFRVEKEKRWCMLLIADYFEDNNEDIDNSFNNFYFNTSFTNSW